MDPNAVDGDACTSCGGEIEYHEEARAFICTECGIVSDNGRDLKATHAVENATPNTKISGPKKLSQRTFQKKVKDFTNAAVNASDSLGVSSPTLRQHFRQLGDEVLECYTPVPKGKHLKLAGLAAALLFCRQHGKPVTLADVCRVGNVAEKELNEAYKRLIAYLNVVVPREDPYRYISRFREAAVTLIMEIDGTGDTPSCTEHESQDAGNTNSRNKHWNHILASTQKAVRVAELMWAAAGRRPMIFAAAAIVIGVRMYATQLAIATPPVKHCCDSIAAVAFVPSRTIVSMHRDIARPFVKSLERTLRTNSRALWSTFHEHVLNLHDSLFEETSGGSFALKADFDPAICAGMLPEARRAIDSGLARRRKILKVIHGDISESLSSTNSSTDDAEVEVIEKLVHAGATDVEILTGHFDSIRRNMHDDVVPAEGENIDSDDSDVDDMLKSEQEVLASSLLATIT